MYCTVHHSFKYVCTYACTYVLYIHHMRTYVSTVYKDLACFDLPIIHHTSGYMYVRKCFHTYAMVVSSTDQENSRRDFNVAIEAMCCASQPTILYSICIHCMPWTRSESHQTTLCIHVLHIYPTLFCLMLIVSLHNQPVYTIPLLHSLTCKACKNMKL